MKPLNKPIQFCAPLRAEAQPLAVSDPNLPKTALPRIPGPCRSTEFGTCKPEGAKCQIVCCGAPGPVPKLAKFCTSAF